MLMYVLMFHLKISSVTFCKSAFGINFHLLEKPSVNAFSSENLCFFNVNSQASNIHSNIKKGTLLMLNDKTDLGVFFLHISFSNLKLL